MFFVSVIIPTYNRANYIREAVDSAIRQNPRQVEIIVIDDGSADNTKEILKDYVEEKKIIYRWQENAGRSEARNHGAQIARGEFLLFLDSDDLLHEQAIENLQKLSLAHPRSGIFGGQVGFFSGEEAPNYNTRFNFPGNFADAQIIAGTAEEIFLSVGAYMIRKDAFFKDKGFIKAFEPAEDLDISIKSLHANLFTWSKDFVVADKRRHEENTDETKLHEASYLITRHYLQELEADRLPNFQAEKNKLRSNLYERLFKNCIGLKKKRQGTYYFIKMMGGNWGKLGSIKNWKFLAYLLSR